MDTAPKQPGGQVSPGVGSPPPFPPLTSEPSTPVSTARQQIEILFALAIDDIPESSPAFECIQEIKTAGLRAKDVVSPLGLRGNRAISLQQFAGQVAVRELAVVLSGADLGCVGRQTASPCT